MWVQLFVLPPDGEGWAPVGRGWTLCIQDSSARHVPGVDKRLCQQMYTKILKNSTDVSPSILQISPSVPLMENFWIVPAIWNVTPLFAGNTP